MAATPSGKDKILRYARVLVGGYDLSGDARTFSSLDNSMGEVDVSGWSETVRNYLADCIRQVGIRGFQALLNDTAGRAFAILKDADNTYNVSVMFGGGGEPDVPDPAYLLPGLQMMDNTSMDGAAMINADFLPKSGESAGNPLGVVLGNAAISATGNGSSHDNGGSTTNGWHALLHVTATSGGDYEFKLEHSTDDSAWSTLGTFTADGSAVTSEHLTGTGTVNQYVRRVDTRTAGSVTISLTFARN